MAPSLSLHQMSAMDVAPVDLIALAAQVGCRSVCLFLHQPAPRFQPPMPVRAEKTELLRRMRDLDVSLTNIEVFFIDVDTEIEDFRPAFAFGAELAAKRAVIHIQDPDWARASDRFAALCDMGREFGIMPCVEFWALAGSCNNIATTVDFLVRVDHPNSGMAIDSLHVMRTGGSAAEVAAIPPRWPAYGQLCDGPAQLLREQWRDEALHDRKVPGRAELPLVDLVRACPAGLPFDVEVPQHPLRDRGVPALERVSAAVAGARAVLTAAGRAAG